MDVCLLIKQRLEELKLEQKDLATAAGVTDSYISQLLTRKKLPPAPDRTDIYVKIGKFLKLPAGKLSELAGHERMEELKKRLSDSPAPLFKEVRELILRKCAPEKEKEIRSIFERQPFGELERLVTQKLLDVVKRVAKEELESESWLKRVAQLNGRSYQEIRVSVLEFLDTDVFNLSVESCTSFLDPLIDSWDIDLNNFGIEIVLNRRLTPGFLKKLEFVEKEPDGPFEEESGLKEFLRDSSLSGNATGEEIEFLKKLRFKASRPTALYYYRELQNLRDPLNFRKASVAPLHKYGDASGVEKQIQLHSREGAIQRWAENKAGRSPKRRKTKASR
ncbi:MAG: helix-turn-helix transcriptional regulator [Candidatus Acidiferrales bacterium]